MQQSDNFIPIQYQMIIYYYVPLCERIGTNCLVQSDKSIRIKTFLFSFFFLLPPERIIQKVELSGRYCY